MALEDKAERERAAQLRQRGFHRVLGRQALGEIRTDEMHRHLGIGLAGEPRALLFQRLAQFAEILDDAVVNDGDAVGGMRMRVGLGRLAVGGPAGMADADMPLQRRGLEPGFEIFQFAFGATALQVRALERRHTGGIVAAIFQPLQGIDQQIRNRTTPQNSDNAAHGVSLSKSA